MMKSWVASKMAIFDNIKSILFPKPLVLENGKEVKRPFRSGLVASVIMLVLVAVSMDATNFSMSLLISRGSKFFVILKKMVPPNWDYLPKVWDPMFQTIGMSIFGTFLAGLVGLPLAYFSAVNMNDKKIIRAIFRFVMSIFRTIPVLMLALILTYVFGIGTFTGMMALFLFTTAILAKMTYEQIELVDMGPFEASLSAGTSRAKAFVVSIVPQISGFYISTLLYNLEMNIRSAAILGYVGAGGIGILMNDRISLRMYADLSVVLLLLLITVVAIEALSRAIRKRLV